MRKIALAAMALVACHTTARPTVALAPAASAHAGAPACSVSEATTRLLRRLRRPLQIEAFVTQDTPESRAQAARLERILRPFADASSSVTVRTIDVRTEDDRARADKLGVKPFDSRYCGVVLTYGAEHDTIPYFEMKDDDPGGEFWIASHVSQLYDQAEGVHHRIGVLVGHGEMGLAEANLIPTASGTPSMREVIVKNFPTLEFVDVDLHGGATPIDETLEGLLVTQPARDLDDRELRRIDDFVVRGRMLVVLASAVNVAAGDATMTATLSTHGLEQLLGGYGIEMHRDVVLDFERSFQVQVATQSGVGAVRFPAILQVEDQSLLDPSFPAFFRMDQVVLPFASSLEIHREKQPNATLKVLARSTSKSMADTHGTVDLGIHAWKADGPWRPFDVAAYAEGKLHSAFGAGVIEGGRTGRVLVIASSQLTANPFARAGNASNDEKLLQLAGPYAQIAGNGSPILSAIIVLHNVLEMIAEDPAFTALAARPSCRR